MSFKNQFTDYEWTQLELAPIWMFLIVAGIDSKVDKKEMTEFAKQLMIAPSHSTSFGVEVFESVQRNIAELLDAARGGNPLEGLQAVSGLLHKIPDSERKDFIASLVLIGHAIADSSGSLFKKNVSEKETAGIVVAAAILEGAVPNP